MNRRIGVFGAGAIGGFVGVHLSAGGADVTLLGRRSLLEHRGRLRARRVDGTELAPGDALTLTDDPEALRGCAVILVTVKSQDTVAAAQQLAAIADPDCVFVSLQNGIDNARELRAALGPRVIAGIVSYNIIREQGGALLRQTTSGTIITGVGAGPKQVAAARTLERTLARAGLELELRDDIDRVLAGKLVINLINGVCAASGRSLATTLRSRDLRWCWAQCMREGLEVLTRDGREPANIIGLPAWLLPRVLGLPNFIVTRIAGRLVEVDPAARSSTLQDLERAAGATEIDALNGAIVRLARRHGQRAPANEIITDVVQELAKQRPPLRFVAPAELRARVSAARR